MPDLTIRIPDTYDWEYDPEDRMLRAVMGSKFEDCSEELKAIGKRKQAEKAYAVREAGKRQWNPPRVRQNGLARAVTVLMPYAIASVCVMCSGVAGNISRGACIGLCAGLGLVGVTLSVWAATGGTYGINDTN